MFRELDFQTKVFDALDYYLDVLAEHKGDYDFAVGQQRDNPDRRIELPHFPEKAFNQLKEENRLPKSRQHTPYSPRKDGTGRPVPNLTLKVPTGGGKTYLAVKSASKILNKYLGQNKGFVLWIVPNEAIYSQTLKSFKDRAHPYRQGLDRAAAGRVKILTKTDSLNKADVESHLCVMVLMLQSANRTTKETLKMFRDRGDIHGFVPPDGDQEAHKKLQENILNLDSYIIDEENLSMFPQVKDSLGNALRIIQPVVVMDEGHKAIADLAYETLYGFNPSFVLELTATPKDIKARAGKQPQEARYANLLIEIIGVQLNAEGMIKMPLNLDARQGTDWKETLNAAVDQLKSLRKEAITFQAESSRYIRPIMLVQVERTGKDQRDGGHIHAHDAKEWLLQTGFEEDEIAIKTADQNDLENQDLLSSSNKVRVIITKEALQEGWDCPFAYVLCSLAARGNMGAMTQLIGRILRQPHAKKTNIAALDQCHVFTHQARTRDLIEEIKKGLEKDGLSDLVLSVSTDAAASDTDKTHRINRSDTFKKTKIYLPKVLKIDGKKARELDYDTDVAFKIDWKDYDPIEVANAIPLEIRSPSSQMHQINIAPDDSITSKSVSVSHVNEDFDFVYATRAISDVVTNPFVGRQIVGKLVAQLKENGFDKAALGQHSIYIIEELRRQLIKTRDQRAENHFKESVESGDIEFRFRLDGADWTMPNSIESAHDKQSYQLLDDENQFLEKSVFSPVYANEMNRDEQGVAIYLDGEESLRWWHRNIAKKHYGIRGWQRGVVYPDFIFSLEADGKTQRLIALEMKGDHLDNNLDTTYKRTLMEYLTEHFVSKHATSAGELEVSGNGVTVECKLILFSKWKTELPKLIQG